MFGSLNLSIELSISPGAMIRRGQDQPVLSALLAASLYGQREEHCLMALIALNIGTGPTNANPAETLESWRGILACIIIRHVSRNWFVCVFAKASAHSRNSCSAIFGCGRHRIRNDGDLGSQLPTTAIPDRRWWNITIHGIGQHRLLTFHGVATCTKNCCSVCIQKLLQKIRQHLPNTFPKSFPKAPPNSFRTYAQ